VRSSVAQGSAPDIYLGRALKYATLVRTPATPQALDLLGTGQVDAFAGGRGPQVMAFIACCLPGGRLLPDNYLIANLAMVVPDTATGHGGAGLQYIDEFVEWAKTTGLFQLAIDRAKQGGTHVTPALPPAQRIWLLLHPVTGLGATERLDAPRLTGSLATAPTVPSARAGTRRSPDRSGCYRNCDRSQTAGSTASLRQPPGVASPRRHAAA